MIEIRQAKAADYDDVEKLYSDLIDTMCNSEFRPKWKMGIYPTEQQLKSAIEGQTLLLAHLDNILVGALILNRDCTPEYEGAKWQTDAKKDEVMFIHLLGVSPSYHGKGVAKEIMACVIDICGKGSIKAIRLDVLKSNIPAIKLYTSVGFQYIDSLKLYYEDTGWMDFLLYELVL